MNSQNAKINCDVLVVGAAYAGLAAALEAAEAGASVIVLGRPNPFASNSAIGGGKFTLVDTAIQRKQGIRDSAKFLIEDILKANSYSIPKDIVTAVAEESTQLYEWMIKLGARFCEVVQTPGHSVARVHQESGMSGANTLRLLLETARGRGIDIRLGTLAEHLILNKGKEVEGLLATCEKEKMEIYPNKAIILAAGGFGRNAAMMAEYLPHLVGVSIQSAAGSTGDGIRMGIEIGAETSNMDAALLTTVNSHKRGSWILELAHTIDKGAILVNRDGKRFTDEIKGFDRLTLPIIRQPGGMAFLVFDEGILNSVEQIRESIDKYRRMNLIQYGRTVQELALVAAINPLNLEESVRQHLPVENLYGAWVKPILFQTHGGLKVNARAQVIHCEGYLIPHLYSAGDNTPGLGGAATEDCPCPGYLTGCGYLWALGMGRIAGRNAARDSHN